MSIRIVTDSTADLPRELIERYRITVVPLAVLFGDEELLDGVDITSEQFFERLVQEDRVPTTAQPSAGAFQDAYRRLEADGATGILSVHISGNLSGTLESARQGAAEIGIPVRHVDSQLVSLGIAAGVVEAARAIEDGRTLDEAQAAAEDACRRTRIFVTIDTLEYLRRGGRMSRGQELIGSLLQVKPVITVEGGEVLPLARVRTRRRAVEDIVNRTLALGPLSYTLVCHATSPEESLTVGERLREAAPRAMQIASRLGPVLGVHGGPGVMGCGGVMVPDQRSPGFLQP